MRCCSFESVHPNPTHCRVEHPSPMMASARQQQQQRPSAWYLRRRIASWRGSQPACVSRALIGASDLSHQQLKFAWIVWGIVNMLHMHLRQVSMPRARLDVCRLGVRCSSPGPSATSNLSICRFGNRISSSEGQPPLSADAHGPGTLATQVVDYADGASAVYYSATCDCLPALQCSCLECNLATIHRCVNLADFHDAESTHALTTQFIEIEKTFCF